jgi:hypothetical protein
MPVKSEKQLEEFAFREEIRVTILLAFPLAFLLLTFFKSASFRPVFPI